MLLQSGVGKCSEKLCRSPKLVKVEEGGQGGVGGGGDGLEMHAAAECGREVISSVFVQQLGERYRWATYARPHLLFKYVFISPLLSLMFPSAEWFPAR